MTKDELLALADRCEAAPPEQQRALLEEAFWHVFPANVEMVMHGPFTAQLDCHAYESAALSMMPEGWLLAELSDLSVAGGSRCVLGNPGTGSSAYSDNGARTLALAITAALLRAKAQEVE